MASSAGSSKRARTNLNSDGAQTTLQGVENAIVAVEDQIKSVQQMMNDAWTKRQTEVNPAEKDILHQQWMVFAKEEEQLREEKKQLREEKKQLRTKEEQLRTKDEQLRREKEQARELAILAMRDGSPDEVSSNMVEKCT